MGCAQSGTVRLPRCRERPGGRGRAAALPPPPLMNTRPGGLQPLPTLYLPPALVAVSMRGFQRWVLKLDSVVDGWWDGYRRWDVCTAGLDALALRTAAWVKIAMDYSLQAMDGNAGVIAQQICSERPYASLVCLGQADSAADRCAYDPNWLSTAGPTFTCATYTSTAIERNHNYCGTDADAANVLAAVACPAACGSCTPQDSSSPAAVLHEQHDQVCSCALALFAFFTFFTFLQLPSELNIYLCLSDSPANRRSLLGRPACWPRALGSGTSWRAGPRRRTCRLSPSTASSSPSTI